MARKMIGIIGVILLAFVATSCTVRSYVQERNRVDQEMPGNAGCLQGSCQPVDRSNIRKTRKTYVLEFTKNPKNVETQDNMSEDIYSETYVEDDSDSYTKSSYKKSESVVIYNNEEPVAKEETVYVDYVVQEGDTLQKISKKSYDTYKRWYEIYEINKDVLPNPDRIKPGKVIKIPQPK
ncbi:MAG: LysM peptidoglycan-binding domain-containing protein [Candidatus Omnitrophica bacterium]|nr:LysM peptidoglycan-binding domain-containing protein [Candidatus Omnitrophota bacterium]